MQEIVGNDHAVTGPESMLDPFGEVQRLLDADQRVSAELLGLGDLLHHEGGIAFGSFLHLGIVPGQVLSRITAVPAQRLLCEVGGKLVSIRALLGVRTAAVFLLCTQLGAGWASEPPLTGGGGEVCVFSHFLYPPHPRRSR